MGLNNEKKLIVTNPDFILEIKQMRIVEEEQQGNERAEYGHAILKTLSNELTAEFGKGFTVTNLSYMRQFYNTFPIYHSPRDELSWTHYRLAEFARNNCVLQEDAS